MLIESMNGLWKALVISTFCLIFAIGPTYACPDIDGLVDINCDEQLQIIAFGDSITFGRNDPEYLGYPGRLNRILPHATVINLGYPAEHTFGGKNRASKSFLLYPETDYVIILEGVNDYWLEYASPNRTLSNLLSIVSKAQNIGAVTLLANLTAVRRSWQKSWVFNVNKLLAPYHSIDFFSLGESIISNDLLHPNGPGYQAMTELVVLNLMVKSEANRPVDTDADGIYDFAEPRFGTTATEPDADGDGLLDGEEVFTYRSSPLLVDSDDDGFGDYQEVREMGSNPADPRPGAVVLTSIKVLPNTE